MNRGSRPTIDQLVAATFSLAGVGLGARSISDNSAFTHLRTGIDMVQHGFLPAIPRTDAYSFTAFGHPWVVQSWLAEAGVGWTDRIGGHGAVVALCAVTMGALAWLVATLARTGRPASTAATAFAALAIGFPFWSPRPLLVGLVCLALTILVVERRHSPWLLVPIVWVWVNSHGSFPLGLAWIGATCVGAWIDVRSGADADRPEVPWPYLGAFIAGMLAGAVNPLGPRLLSFTGAALAKRDVFRHIVEWKTVDFQSVGGLVCLVGLGVAFMILARRRVAWRYLLPVAGFLGMGLLAQRNLAPLGVVVAPALASVLRDEQRAPAERSGLNLLIAGVLVVLAAALVAGGTAGPAIDASSYPGASVDWLAASGRLDAPHRLVAPDSVGNYLELLAVFRAPNGHETPQEHQEQPALVFIDDRVDMYPASVSEDYQALLAGGNRALRVLTKWNVDTVLWRSRTPLVDRLVADGDWSVAHRTSGWVVIERGSVEAAP